MGKDDDLISPTDPDASAFADAARAYCDFIDAAIVQRPDPFYEPLQGLLVRLVELVEPLPCPLSGVTKRAQRAFDRDHPSRDWWCLAEIMSLLGDDPRALFNELGEADHETRRLTIHGDLAEIYVDLQEGLAWWDQGDARSCTEAVWLWRFGYEQHWGSHCFEVLWTVHEMRFRLLQA